MANNPLNQAAMQQQLNLQAGSKTFWRSLEELAQQPEFLEQLADEFPRQMRAGGFHTDRRTVLKLMGATLVMAGLTSCTPQPPRERIVPYVNAPEELLQGRPLFFATAMPWRGCLTGLLVESHMGRPTKIEGNPRHPASLGATDAFAQASIYGLYDPDRAQTVSERGEISTWEAFLNVLTPKLAAFDQNQGTGLHLLTETVTSPTLADQIRQLRARFPQLQWHQYEPYNQDNVLAGAQLAFGSVLNPVYHLDQAERILALDADFLFTLPGSLAYARAFIDRRRVAETGTMNRLYVVESTPTITGAKADHRLPLRASQIDAFTRALAQALGVAVDGAMADLDERQQQWLAAVVQDLQEHRGASLIIAGDTQPPTVHALAHALNAALGSVGRTVTYTAPVLAEPTMQVAALQTLVQAMAVGQVDTLLLLESNPVFTAPADFNFAHYLQQVPLTIHASLYADETTQHCHWHIPTTHYLESWGDGRAYDGTISILQPLIAPLFNGKNPHEILAALLGESSRSAYEIVRSFWDNYYTQLNEPPPGGTDAFWQTALYAGIVANSALAPVAATLVTDLSAQISQASRRSVAGIELNFRADPSVWDGRFANNAWLQELPQPLTKLTWDNVALISPATAARLGLASGDLVELQQQGHTLTVAVWIMPGQPDDAVTLQLGYGSEQGGQVRADSGFNSYQLRTAANFWFGGELTMTPTGQQYALASAQTHHAMEGRELVRVGTLAQFQADPTFAQTDQQHSPRMDHEAEITSPSLYPEYQYESYAWGMAIDSGACIGCNACVVACQVENNGPTVGKAGVLQGREMHWLKIDRYYAGAEADPETYFQPRLCMHCEKAPCEPVCPVAATVHDGEGLNQMVYNRCVGTRYCSNNCPYKVRRFNFYNYNAQTEEIPLLQMGRNPDVTMRSRGVMEKCTYCVQRINYARIEAEKENRPIRDGEVRTACQAACPTRAIIFGDINQPESQVAQLKAQPLNYGLLTELGTQPRTTYLAEVRNPNPALEETE